MPQLTVESTWLARPSAEVAPDLIGCTLVRQLSNEHIRGTIVETEAYGSFDDPACHAYRRQTSRNRVMFGMAGMSYVYLIYGRYHCLNVVTDRDSIASAVLIRALHLEVIPSSIEPRQVSKPFRIAAGPGKLCDVLQIDRSLSGRVLQPGQPLWLEHRPPELQPELVQTTRIGLTRGTDLPWRWYLKDCLAVSRL